MNEIIIKGHKIVGGKALGRAVVSVDPVCFLKTIDLRGFGIEKGHALEGKNVAGTILVFPTGKGSTAGSYKIYQMALDGFAPKAIINTTADSITVSGAILGKIPMVHKFDVDPTEVIETGDKVSVDGDMGTVMVIKNR